MKLQIKRSLTENDVIEGCRGGNHKAQRQLYELYSSRMLGLCRRYISDQQEAEDVLIKGFLRVFEKIGQFRGDGSFEGWIKRIMINESLAYLRKNKAMYVEVDIDKAGQLPNYGMLSGALETEDLLRMVNALPMGYRSVFNLYAIEGYSHKEIAEMLNINESTSKSQLSRARAVLQGKLREAERGLNNKLKGHEDQ